VVRVLRDALDDLAPRSEFRKRVGAEERFVRSVLHRPKLFVVGTEEVSFSAQTGHSSSRDATWGSRTYHTKASGIADPPGSKGPNLEIYPNPFGETASISLELAEPSTVRLARSFRPSGRPPWRPAPVNGIL